MAWRYRSPSIFPARYPEALRQCVARLEESVLLHSGSEESCRLDAENFRYYRWCLRKKPDFDRNLSGYFDFYNIRTQISVIDGSGLLYLSAKPSLLSDLRSLNPHLSELIALECQ